MKSKQTNTFTLTLSNNIAMPYMALAIVWFIAIAIACLSDGNNINNSLHFIPHTDKLVHALSYFIATFLLLRAFIIQKKHNSTIVIILIMLFCLFYGVLIEYLQAKYANNRSADFLDVVANFTGQILAIITYFKLYKLKIV